MNVINMNVSSFIFNEIITMTLKWYINIIKFWKKMDLG